MKYEEAEEYCKKLGGRLARSENFDDFKDEASRKFVVRFITNTYAVNRSLVDFVLFFVFFS